MWQDCSYDAGIAGQRLLFLGVRRLQSRLLTLEEVGEAERIRRADVMIPNEVGLMGWERGSLTVLGKRRAL